MCRLACCAPARELCAGSWVNMVSMVHILDVLPYLETADAVKLIAAAGVHPEMVPQWPKAPVQKLQVGPPSYLTEVLLRKGYFFVIHEILPFDSKLAPNGDAYQIAKSWIMAISVYGFAYCQKEPYLSAVTSRYLDHRYHHLDTMIAMLGMHYFNPNALARVMCYMDKAGECFIGGQTGWERIQFEKLLAKMSQFIIDTFGNALAKVRRIYKISAANKSRQSFDKFRKTWRMRITGIDPNNKEHADAIKRMLQRNAMTLAKHCAI